jgi:hypothetical protein
MEVTAMTKSIPPLVIAWMLVAGASAAEPAPAPRRDTAAPATDSRKPPAAGNEQTAATRQVAKIEYQPPRRGAPRTRTGGGTRTDGAWPSVTVLTPEHTGLTASAQPNLYWRLSADVTARFEFVLIDDKQPPPVWRETVTGAMQQGVHVLSLQAAGVTLQPGVTYRWSVAIVADPAQRSRDVVSSGTIERVALEPAVQAQLGQVQPQDRARVYAANGLWYDALAALAAQLAAQPEDRTALADRDALLEQGGISRAAAP